MNPVEMKRLKIERTFDAAPEQLWDAWTQPQHIAKWWNPASGIDADVHEVDLRVGGKLRLTMHVPEALAAAGTDRFPVVATFVVLKRPHEIVLRAIGEGANEEATLTVRFERVGGRTRMTFEAIGPFDDEMLASQDEGWGVCFDNLAKHVETQKPQEKVQVMNTMQPKTLKLERTFDASPKELWAAWTDPKQYAQWFNPAGLGLVIHEFDVRPGGKIRFDMPQPDGNKNPQDGVFHTLNPYTEIVSGAPDKSFLLHTRFVPVGSRTRVVIEMTGVPPEFHENATQGWSAIFDKLDLELAKHTAIGGQSWSMHRDFDCTPEQLWAALTEPQHFVKWISPFNAPTEIPQFEPRPGGRIRFIMTGEDGTRYPEAEWLVEVADKPRLFVIFEANLDRTDIFNGRPMRASMRIEPRGKHQVRLVLSQQGLPDDFPIDMAKQGFNAGLDKLAKLVGSVP